MSTKIDLEVTEAAQALGALRIQWVGGFYPAGAVVALQLVAGRGSLVAEKLYNPAEPEARAQLERLTKERDCLVGEAKVHHGEQARRELRALLDKADRSRAGRVDWQRAAQEFQRSG